VERFTKIALTGTVIPIQDRFDVSRYSARDKNNVERYLKIEGGCVFELE